MFTGIPNSKRDNYLFQIEEEMGKFVHFYEFADAKIAQERIELAKDVDAKLDEDGEVYYVGPMNEISRLYSASSLLYQSTFIALYSFFELQLTSLVNEFAGKRGVRVKLSDLKADSEMQRVQKYLDKIFNLDLSSISGAFEELHEYRKMRNAFVHHDGYMSKEGDGKNLIAKIKQNPSLNFSLFQKEAQGGYLSIKDSTFVRDFAFFIPKFLGQIFSKLYPEEIAKANSI